MTKTADSGQRKRQNGTVMYHQKHVDIDRPPRSSSNRHGTEGGSGAVSYQIAVSHEGGLVQVFEERVLEGTLGRQPRLGVVRQQLLSISNRARQMHDRQAGGNEDDSVSCDVRVGNRYHRACGVRAFCSKCRIKAVGTNLPVLLWAHELRRHTGAFPPGIFTTS